MPTFALAIKQQAYGTLADRLGNGLQNRVEQFDSARYLNKKRVCQNSLILKKITKP